MIRARRGALLLGTVLVAGALVSSGATVAAAAPHAADRLLVSHDGVAFSPDLTLGVFGDIERVVPADVVTETVWVRNAGDAAGVLRVDLLDVVATDPVLAAAVSLDVDVPGGVDRPGTSLGDAAAQGCRTIAGDRVLQPGETIALTAVLSVDADLGSAPGDTGREGVQQSLGFDLRALLVDAAVPVGDGTVCADVPDAGPDDPTGALPTTGAELPFAAIAAALALGALGGLLNRRRRRSRPAEDA